MLKFFSPLYKLHLQNKPKVVNNGAPIHNTSARYLSVWRLYCLHAYLHTFATEKAWQARCHSAEFHFPPELKQFFYQIATDKEFFAIGKSCFTSFFGFPISAQRSDNFFVQKISSAERWYNFKNKSVWYTGYQFISMFFSTLKNSLKFITEFVPYCLEAAVVAGYSSALVYYQQTAPRAYLRHCVAIIAMSALALLYCTAKLTRILAKPITSPVRSACEGWRVSKPLGVLSVLCTIAAYVFLLPIILPAAAPGALGFLGAKFASAMTAIKVAFPFAGLSLTGKTATAIGAHLAGEVAVTLTSLSFLKTVVTRPAPALIVKGNPLDLQRRLPRPNSADSTNKSARTASSVNSI